MFGSISILLVLFIAVNSVSGFVPHKVSLSNLELKTDDAKSAILTGLEEVGLITINEIPNFEEIRQNILRSSAACLTQSKDESNKLEFGDKSKRYSMGIETNEGVSNGLKLDLSIQECVEFNELQEQFRALVSDITTKFSDLLDESLELNDKKNRLLFDTDTMEAATSISQIVSEGTHLEHFHLYEKKTTLNDLYATDFTRRLHTDQGLFIVLSPALTLNSETTSDHGFFIQLKNGEIVQPDFGKNKAELVFMIGDGYSQWISPKTKVQFRATPHAVIMPYNANGLSKRSWYGRMILPKHSMFLEAQQQTFSQLKNKMTSQNENDVTSAKFSACSNGLVLGDRLLQSCGDDELFCWLECVPLNVFGCSDTEVESCGFFEGDDFVECDPSIHGTQCGRQCVEEDIASSSGSIVGNDFCNGFGVSMYMQGFTGIKDERQGCIVFLFEDLKIDSTAKYFLASVASLLIGIITEMIVFFRRKVAQNDKIKNKSMLKIVLYASQVTFGYIAMLIAMTYSIILFTMIVLGLTIGHRIFNFKVVPKEFSDACCAEPVEAKSTPKTL